MALSPAEYKAASANTAAVVAKAKALTILSNNANRKPSVATSATKDLSEQLNEETRSRYEKGMPTALDREAVAYLQFQCFSTVGDAIIKRASACPGESLVYP